MNVKNSAVAMVVMVDRLLVMAAVWVVVAVAAGALSRLTGPDRVWL